MNKKNTVAAYSLGNFVSNQRAPKNRLSLMVFLKLGLFENAKLVLQETRSVPLWLERSLEKDGTSK